MVLRPSLPPVIAERLVTLVSREWQTQLVNRHALPARAAADIILSSREQAILHLSMGASDTGLHDMVAQMHRNGRLPPTLMLRACAAGISRSSRRPWRSSATCRWPTRRC